MQAHGAHASGNLGVLGGQRAAFSAREVLGRVEGEARGRAALAPQQAALVPRTERVRGILDHWNPGDARQIVNPVRDGYAAEVHGDDRVDARRQRGGE